MHVIFVHELNDVRERLGWDLDTMNEEQHHLLRQIVLCERRIKHGNTNT
jgi:hypothetical protein